MAIAQLIDLSNYQTLLKQSTQPREGTPDGNIYFDTTNGRLQIITREELSQVDLGSGLEDNPLTNQTGIKFEALYAFENQERLNDENLRKFDRYFKGTFKFGGAYELINGRKFDDALGSGTSSTTDDRAKIRGSGWIERDASGNIGRVYYGVRSLGNIENSSQPYYQLNENGVPTNFAKPGPVDEAVQVYGDAGVDSTTTTFDYRTFLSMKVRTFGNNYDEKKLSDSGVSQMDGYASGFALGESPHLTTNSYSLSTVLSLESVTGENIGTGDNSTTVFYITNAPIAPKVEAIYVDGTLQVRDSDYTIDFKTGEITFTTPPAAGLAITADYLYSNVSAPFKNMYLEKLSTPLTVSGFKEGDGIFTWVLRNPDNGSLYDCIAYLDAIAQDDNIIDMSGNTDTHGKRVGVWYTYNSAGQIVTRSGADSLGLYIENIPVVDQQSITYKTDSAAIRTWPYKVAVEVSVGAFAVADANAWYHAFFLSNYNTPSAVTVIGDDSNPVKGMCKTDAVNNKISFGFDYDGDTLGGTAATDKDVVFLCEGDGGATQAKTVFTITRTSKITASAEPGLETNV